MQDLALAKSADARVSDRPGNFRMASWGFRWGPGRCYHACLGGHTLLAAGYRLIGPWFFKPDGLTRVKDPGKEARDLLGLTNEEYYSVRTEGGVTSVFNGRLTRRFALAKFRDLIMAEELRRSVTDLSRQVLAREKAKA
jgi:hypothetical protein